VAVEALVAQADPEAAAAALALAVPAVEVAAERMPAICGERRGRVVVVEERLEARAVVERVAVVEPVAAELESVVAVVRAAALAVPVAEVVQGAAHLEALSVQLVLRERRERRPANG